jgi:hypothetical protein
MSVSERTVSHAIIWRASGASVGRRSVSLVVCRGSPGLIARGTRSAGRSPRARRRQRDGQLRRHRRSRQQLIRVLRSRRRALHGGPLGLQPRVRPSGGRGGPRDLPPTASLPRRTATAPPRRCRTPTRQSRWWRRCGRTRGRSWRREGEPAGRPLPSRTGSQGDLRRQAGDTQSKDSSTPGSRPRYWRDDPSC